MARTYMQQYVRSAALLGLLLASCAGFASQEDCSEPFVGGVAPALVNPKLAQKTRQLCYSEYTVLHSGVTRGPLWSGEDLTKEKLSAAATLPRPSSNTFHEEERLSIEERSSLDDYRRSGYDRGHMTPNGDMSTPQAQQESFTLANIVPQAPCNNELLWDGIENAVRSLALNEAEVFIVTGPAFKGAEPDSLKGRVLVPTHIFKAVYIPPRDEAAAYWAPNDDTQTWEAITIARLKELTDIDPFPSLPESVKTSLGHLPSPATHRGCRSPPPTPEPQRPTAAGEFRTEAEAKAHCPGDTVVWANTRSKIYHYASNWRYGRTKIGAYMCARSISEAASTFQAFGPSFRFFHQSKQS